MLRRAATWARTRQVPAPVGLPERDRALAARWFPIGIATAAASGSLWHVLARSHPRVFGSFLDLSVYLAGGRALLDGHQLYSAAYTRVHLPFTYPPFAAMIFATVARVPFGTVARAMELATLGGLFGVLWLTLGSLGYRAGRGRFGVALMAWSVLLWTEPVLQNLKFGQVNLLLMLAVVADLVAVRHRWFRGIGVGFATAFKLVPAIFIPYLLITRQWRAASVAAGAVAVTIGVSFLFFPLESRQYWGGLFFDSTRVGGAAFVGNQSIHGLIFRAMDGSAAAQPVWLVVAAGTTAIALGASWWYHRQGRELLAVAIVALGGLLASPISWSHHWVWALPLLIALVMTPERRSRSALGAAIALCAVFVAWPMNQGRGIGTLPTGLIWLVPNRDGREFGWSGGQIVLGELYTLAGLAALLVLAARAGTAYWRATREEQPAV